jgi:hypothetical protein
MPGGGAAVFKLLGVAFPPHCLDRSMGVEWSAPRGTPGLPDDDNGDAAPVADVVGGGIWYTTVGVAVAEYEDNNSGL